MSLGSAVTLAHETLSQYSTKSGSSIRLKIHHIRHSECEQNDGEEKGRESPPQVSDMEKQSTRVEEKNQTQQSGQRRPIVHFQH
ncbi:hypothetical protein BaRGS_00006492 [Batillaria attramentaria]|uniref:Uncharacterized protein n=1 Tax=Batillaria attramentaria TaxID=370345 RepID=A0ABD0LSR8_9CAEN